MKKSASKGFTLIELLVVIAIIGILASIVLVNLNSARSKGTDAKTKAELANARSQAEIVYDTDGDSYDGVCQDATISKIVTDTSGDCLDSDETGGPTNGWSITATLSDGSTVYCVDSTGFSGAADRDGTSHLCATS